MAVPSQTAKRRCDFAEQRRPAAQPEGETADDGSDRQRDDETRNAEARHELAADMPTGKETKLLNTPDQPGCFDLFP